MVVHFELLGSHLEMTLRDIISFLGLEVDERRLKVRTLTKMINLRALHFPIFQCTVDNSEGEFHRKKKISENDDSDPKLNPYTNEQR